MKIAILGAGAFGTALGMILAERGNDIDYYDRRVERERLKDVMVDASYVVLCIPSAAVSYMIPHLPKDKPLIVATKGLLSNDMFRDFEDYMVLSGPGFATDIKEHLTTHLTATDSRIVDMFTTDYLTFDMTKDARGVLMCGSLKNVYALQAGYLGLKRDSKDWKTYIKNTSDEMRAILKLNGADPKTVDLSCGIGDLELTCGYPSRNYEFGDLLRGNPDYEPEKTVEGLSALKRIKRGDIKIPKDAVIMKEIMNGFKC